MNQLQQQQKLAGQTTLANKVFQCVPISEPWGISQISGEFGRTLGRVAEHTTLRGCLTSLAEAGLIKSSQKNTLFQRVPVKAEKPTIIKKEEVMTTPANKPQASTESVLDLFGDIAKKIRSIADDIDAAALKIEEASQSNAQKLAMLDQLKVLLK